MFNARDIKKHYTKSGVTIAAVDGLDLAIEPGEYFVLLGPSGSGKSTLLLMLGGMLTPSHGTVHCSGTDLYGLSRGARNRFRRNTVGFLFQKFYLLPYLTVFDNIRMPLLLQGERRAAEARVTELARRLRIDARLGHRPAELSVGEQQRVAMARTLVAEPEVVLADEPTGNLDKDNRDVIADCFAEENRRGRTIVLATHDEALLNLGHRRLLLKAGQIQREERGEPTP